MPSKKVTMRASMSNQTTHFGIMGGLFNRKISGRSSLNRVTSRLEIPAGAEAGLRYMKLHNLLSRNPLGSGGVGRMFNIRPRGSGAVLKHTNLSIETEVVLETEITSVPETVTYKLSNVNLDLSNPTCDWNKLLVDSSGSTLQRFTAETLMSESGTPWTVDVYNNSNTIKFGYIAGGGGSNLTGELIMPSSPTSNSSVYKLIYDPKDAACHTSNNSYITFTPPI